MRKPGIRDAWLALKLYDLRREDELRAARNMVGTHLYEKTWEDVRPLLDYEHPENAHLRQVTAYWDMAASFVLRGIWHPDVFLDSCDEGLFTYAVLEEHLGKIREHRPSFFVKMEQVLQEHPRVKGRLMEVRARIFRERERRSGEATEA
ncbi:MAG: DUF4760 domain-containing protein, partial [Planctomycetota bacterium]|jgi:hypothetical protein